MAKGRPVKTFYTASRATWRSWLKKHCKTEKEIWLVYYRKGATKPRIAYNDAVEEALCFGWIDSTVRKIDGQRFAQRFTPRRPGSTFSQPNKERLHRLIKQGKVAKGVLALLGSFSARNYAFPAGILDALKADPRVWKNFKAFSDSYKRIRVAYVEDAKARPEEFRRRLRNLIKKTGENKKFGFGGIEKYYR